MSADGDENDSLRRASHATASSWRALARKVAAGAPEAPEDKDGQEERFATLCDRLQATREENLLMEEYPDYKRQKKLEETNDATKVWALSPNQSTVNATTAPFLKWCEEHFRDVNRRDIESLAPKDAHCMECDADYLIPGLGRHYWHGFQEEDKEEERKMMERKRMAVLNRAETPAKKKKTPKKTVKPKADAKKYQVTRISPLDRPDEIDECCAVCFDGDSYDDNPILFCDKCNVAVHQLCYGIQKIPQGDWICKSCSSRGAAKQCCLCTVKGGALKPTADGRWAHLFCAQWIPEVFLSDVDLMEPINTNSLLSERTNLTCVACKQHGVGACIQCAYGNCSVPFHPMCAMTSGARMEIRSTEKSEDVEYMCYCDKHVKEMERKAQRIANGESSAAATPAKGTEDTPAKVTPPPTPQQEEVKEEATPASALKTTVSPARAENSESTVLNQTMKELNSNEIRRLVSSLFDLSGLTAADIEGVKEDDFMSWLGDDGVETRDKSDSTGTPAKITLVMDPREVAARQWLARKAKEEVLAPVRIDGSAARVSDSAMETRNGSPKVEDDVPSEDSYLYPAQVPHPIATLAEYTRLTLENAKVPKSPKTVEDIIPEQSGPNGIPTNMRPPKCQVCVIRKQGVCGTASAPPRCHRRRENMEKMRAEQLAELKAKLGPGETLPDPVEIVQNELARIEARTDVLKIAPDDEVVAEIYRAQTVLARTSHMNRQLIQTLLRKVEKELPTEEEARDAQRRAQEETSQYEERWRGGRWRMERLRAEGKEEEAQFDGGELAGADMRDPLVESGAMEDALCCVCGGGESEYPNEIIFCERCEMCVHQQCYGVTNIPEGEWLCWPCHETERMERENGHPGTRPPRYMREAGDGAMYDPRVQCLLCPVKRGALRTIIDPRLQTPKTTETASPVAPVRSPSAAKSVPDGKAETNDANADTRETDAPGTPVVKTPSRGRNRWCHVVCAHWQQGMETDLYLDGPAAITGLDEIRPQYKNARCSACRLDDGACIPCSAKNCPVVFHPLCARRCGWHMLPLQSPEPLAFCARHSIEERRNPGSTMRTKYSVNASGARFGQRVSTKKKRTPTPEEMEMLRRARVGLETLRLLCDRVVKRERLKRSELEQHHKLWLAQIRGEASGPIYALDDDTQAHIKIPDVAKDRKLLFLTPAEAFRYEEDVSALPPDIRLVEAEPIDGPFRDDDDEEEGDGEEDKK